MTHPTTIVVTGTLATLTCGDYLLAESADERPWVVTSKHAPARPIASFPTLGSAYLYAQRRQAADDRTPLSAWHRGVSG